MARNYTFGVGEYFHLYNRGTDKRTIFNDRSDYERFVSLLYICNSTLPVNFKIQGPTLEELIQVDRGEPLISIGAYCLMPNHFHLLVREEVDGGVSLFMQKLGTAYTGYFNKRNERSGALFQSKYRASHAAKDEYLKYLISYIHLNPIKLIEPQWKENGITNRSAAKDYLTEYQYSSYQEYMDIKRTENALLNRACLPDYFESAFDFESVVDDWLSVREP